MQPPCVFDHAAGVRVTGCDHVADEKDGDEHGLARLVEEAPHNVRPLDTE